MGRPCAVRRGWQARIAVITLGERRVALAVPTTFMNDSGTAVRALAPPVRYQRPGETIVVLHDELDLVPGTVRLKAGGGLAGHNGLRSVQAHLHSSDFLRVRIGVGKPPTAAQGAAHVLRRPPGGARRLDWRWRRRPMRWSASWPTVWTPPCSGATPCPA